MPTQHSPKNQEPFSTPVSTTLKRKEREFADDVSPNNPKFQRIDDINDSPQLSLKDILNEIRLNEAARKGESSGIRNDIAALRGEVSQQINGLKCSLDTMTTKVNDLKIKVDVTDARIDAVSKIVSENRKMIGSYKQDKIEKFMEIDGIKDSLISNTNDCKKLAIEIIESFGIGIVNEEIEYAFKKEVNLKKKINGSNSKKILTVIFSNINSKIRVMKAKRDLKNENAIYFNSALTFDNRNLIYKAKTIVKGKLKVYFSRGCVRVQKKDESEIIVDDESKLSDVQNYFDQINSNK
ncbi:hypothetical protein ACKWTF_016551 [Chironomus riparius]